MFFLNRAVVEPEDRIWQYGGALHAGLVTLHARKYAPAPVHPPTHTHTQKYVLLFHVSNGFVNAPRYDVIRIVPVLFCTG